MIGILAYLYIFITQELYFQSFLQLIFIYQLILGWIYWTKNTDVIFNVDKDYSEVLIHTGLVCFGGFLFQIIFRYDNFLDILTTGLSLLANLYIVRRKILGWLLWMITDFLMVVMFMDAKLYFSVILYLFLFIFALKGFISWIRGLKMV